MKIQNRIKLDLSLMATLEFLISHGALDDLPDDDELLYLQEKAEQSGNRAVEWYWKLINWELYQGDELVAYRKPVKDWIVKQYEGVWMWEHDFQLEVNHNGREVLNYKKIENV